MKFVLAITILFLLNCSNEAKLYETNITDFSKCKVHYSRQEKTYMVFYHISDQPHFENDNETILNFHFSVLAVSDAHILLASSSQVTSKDACYEIVLGAGGNRFSDIRRKQKADIRASVRLTDVLSAIDFRSFWIHVYKDFSKCKVHYSRQEKSYKVFYHISDQLHMENDNDIILDFHFSVLAISDAHILLSPSSHLTSKDPVYEIVLGAGDNSFSAIRRLQKANSRSFIRLKGILSAVDIRSFWVHIYKDGLIDVGKEGESLAFLSYLDPDPLPLSVFSFSTWGDVEAKWYFDCPRANKTTHIEEIEKPLSDLEKLRKRLLWNYNPYVRPTYELEETTVIELRYLSHHFDLDEKTSTLNTRSRMAMKWFDAKLIWAPEDFGNITSIHVYHGEIWKPDIYIQNAKNPEAIDAFTGSLLVVSNVGEVSWNPSLNVATFCDLESLNDWPNDVHTCFLDMTVWNHDIQYIELQYALRDDKIDDRKHTNEWKVLELISETFNYQANDAFETVEKPILRLKISMMRISSIYRHIFFTPFLVIIVSMLLSFLSSPFGYIKIALNCIQIILTSMCTIGLSLVMPGHPQKVPFLIYLYSASMVGNVLATLIAIIVINLCRNEYQFDPPYTVSKILNMKYVELILFLPKYEVTKWKGNIMKPSTKEMWIRCGLAIDRIAFYIFSCTVFPTIFSKYWS